MQQDGRVDLEAELALPRVAPTEVLRLGERLLRVGVDDVARRVAEDAAEAPLDPLPRPPDGVGEEIEGARDAAVGGDQLGAAARAGRQRVRLREVRRARGLRGQDLAEHDQAHPVVGVEGAAALDGVVGVGVARRVAGLQDEVDVGVEPPELQDAQELLDVLPLALVGAGEGRLAADVRRLERGEEPAAGPVLDVPAREHVADDHVQHVAEPVLLVSIGDVGPDRVALRRVVVLEGEQALERDVAAPLEVGRLIPRDPVEADADRVGALEAVGLDREERAPDEVAVAVVAEDRLLVAPVRHHAEAPREAHLPEPEETDRGQPLEIEMAQPDPGVAVLVARPHRGGGALRQVAEGHPVEHVPFGDEPQLGSEAGLHAQAEPLLGPVVLPQLTGARGIRAGEGTQGDVAHRVEAEAVLAAQGEERLVAGRALLLQLDLGRVKGRRRLEPGLEIHLGALGRGVVLVLGLGLGRRRRGRRRVVRGLQGRGRLRRRGDRRLLGLRIVRGGGRLRGGCLRLRRHQVGNQRPGQRQDAHEAKRD